MTFHDFLLQYGLQPEVFDVLPKLPKIPIQSNRQRELSPKLSLVKNQLFRYPIHTMHEPPWLH